MKYVFNRYSLKVVNDDLKNAVKIFGSETVDVITVNPPYNTPGQTSTTDEIAIATHELKVNLKEIIVSFSSLRVFFTFDFSGN